MTAHPGADDMELAKIITIVNIIAWLLPPLRQWKKKYHYYFIVLAVSDVLALTFLFSISLQVAKFHFIISIFLLLSIINIKSMNPFKWSYFVLLILLGIFSVLYFELDTMRSLIFVLHCIILLVFIKELFIRIGQKGELNFFYLALVLYELTIVLKYIYRLIDPSSGYIHFYITTVFEMLIAVFFILYHEKNTPKVTLKTSS